MSMFLLGPFVVFAILLFVLVLKVVNKKFPQLSGMKRKLVLAGAIIGVTIITVAGFCIFLAIGLSGMDAPTKPNPTPSSEWKTFSSDTYHMSVSYPSNWYINSFETPAYKIVSPPADQLPDYYSNAMEPTRYSIAIGNPGAEGSIMINVYTPIDPKKDTADARVKPVIQDSQARCKESSPLLLKGFNPHYVICSEHDSYYFNVGTYIFQIIFDNTNNEEMKKTSEQIVNSLKVLD